MEYSWTSLNLKNENAIPQTEDLTSEQIEQLYKAIDEDPDIQVGNLMKLALYTGMRRGELFKLKWDDIDFDRGFIKIRGPKGGRDASIPMSPEAIELLESHPRSNCAYVFPNKNGLMRTDITRDVNRIKKAAGLPEGFRPLHGLRHVYASMLASSGKVDMYTLQKLLTHKSPLMTQRYAHLRDETLKNASDLAGNFFANAAAAAEEDEEEQDEKVKNINER